MNTCKGSRAQSRQIDISRTPVGQQVVLGQWPPCGCCSGCRRVALWHPRPEIAVDSDWTVKVIARVRFGDGCNGPEVEVDWKTGVILDLMGCGVEVALELVEKTSSGGEGMPGEENLFTYGVLVACCGAGGARGCATRTTARITTDAAAFSIIPIPPFAYAVMFAPVGTVSEFFAATTTIGQLGSGAAAIPSIIQLPGDEIPTDGWTLVGGAQSIVVLNAGATELVYEVVFLIGV